MRFDEYREHDATGLALLIRRGDVSASELLETAVERIAATNPIYNAVVHQMYDEARRRIAEGLPDGPFKGVPFLIKDLLADYAGAPLSSGSAFYAGHVSSRHSALVSRFLDAGLVVIGKTNTAEFGLMPVTEPACFGATKNPWNVARTSGGSSGGAGAAVAAGMVPIASGGDGGGSIRIPASCCGLFGFKPTRGRAPTAPYVESWEGLTQEHVLTRSVRDSAAVLDATNVPSVGNPYFTPPPAGGFVGELDARGRRLRIAYTAEPLLGRATHPDCRRALGDAVTLLRELGHELVEAAPVLERRAFIADWVVMMSGQLAADVRDGERLLGLRARREQFQTTTWLSRLIGETLPAGAYVQAARGIKRAGRDFAHFLDEFDVWLTPTLGAPPVAHGAFERTGLLGALERLAGRLGAGRLVVWSGQMVETVEPVFDFASYTPLANAGGQPSMSVPLFWSDAGLPIGTLFTARFGDDALLLKLARELELARPWVSRRPPEPA